MPVLIQPVLGIRNSGMIHVGSSAGLHAHLLEWAASTGTPVSPDMEFYDATGRRLNLVLAGFELVANQPDPTDFDRLCLVDRIDQALATLQVLLNQKIRDLEAAGDEPLLLAELRVLRVPRFSGPLGAVLTTITNLTGLPAPANPTPGDVLHILCLHVTGIPH